MAASTPARSAFVAAMREHNSVSQFFTIHSFDDRPDIRAIGDKALLGWLAEGKIRPLVHARLPLAEARRRHEMLDAGEVKGKLLLKAITGHGR